MNREDLKALLARFKAGEIDDNAALETLTRLPFEDIGDARIDHHRALRTGMPEVIFGESKTPEQIAAIVENMASRGSDVLATRVNAQQAAAVDVILNQRREAGVELNDWSYDASARTLALRSRPFRDLGRGTVAVVCAGTSDLPVAREAFITSEMMNNRTELIVDVGVAGVHRLLAERERLSGAEVIIAVAGMEGALPGVLAGLVGRPVVAVPTSVGYGAAFHGVSALLTMLNSCAPGVTVVNIDNGYGGAAAATLINRRRDL